MGLGVLFANVLVQRTHRNDGEGSECSVVKLVRPIIVQLLQREAGVERKPDETKDKGETLAEQRERITRGCEIRGDGWLETQQAMPGVLPCRKYTKSTWRYGGRTNGRAPRATAGET